MRSGELERCSFIRVITLFFGRNLNDDRSRRSILHKKTTRRILGLTLGFSAGVMINVSFVELLTESINEVGFLHANLAFFVGMAIIFTIDVLIPPRIYR